MEITRSMLYPRMTAARRAVLLDGMWNFQFDPEEKGEKEGWTTGLPHPVSIPVPASFADFFTEKEKREYTGDFWYETKFFVPGEWKGKELLLRFGSVTHRAQVYINGEKAGWHEGGFLPFSIKLDGRIRYNEWNQVVVKGNNELSETCLPAGRTRVLSSGRKMSQPYFDFYNYAGIQRSIWLVALPQTAVCDFSLNYRLEGADARLDYQVELTQPEEEWPQGRRIEVTLQEEEGKQAAAGTGAAGTLLVPQVKLWEVRNAYLYHLIIRVWDGETLLDEYFDEIGIRTVEIRDTDILLNGKPVYLKGFGKHEDSDILGRGFSAGVMKRDFECMKWINANSFRTSHYPYSEEMYQMADREGFLVIDEVAAVGFMSHTLNFMAAGTGKAASFFDKDTIPELLVNHLAALEDMIRRDKNHACVIMWSLMNEPETFSEQAPAYFKQVFDRAWELDVQKRPRTFAMIQNSAPGTCRCYPFSDVLALNRYYGWYSLGGYEMEEAEQAFRKEMDEWQALNLKKPVIFTEFGADTYYAEHKLPSVMWSQEYQKEYLEMCFRVFDSYDFIKGEQVWNFADFQTTEGIMRVNGNKKGIFTRQRQPKDSAFYLKERWAQK